MGMYQIEGGSYIGCHIGDLVYNYYIEQNAEIDMSFNLDDYRQNQDRDFSAFLSQYTPLDVNPLVGVPGEGLRILHQERLPLLDAMRSNRKIMLVGSLGSGKTSSLRFLAHAVNAGSLAYGDTIDGLSWPILSVYVELGRFRLPPGLSYFQCILILIGQTLHAQGAFQGPPPLSAVQEVFEKKRILLLLDGLNEVHADIRNACLQGIEDLAKRYPNTRFIVTARPHTIMDSEGWCSFSICQLDDQQIEMLLDKHSWQSSTADSRRLIWGMDMSLLRTPLYVYLVTELYKSKLGDVQSCLANRSKIVSYYINFLFQRNIEKTAVESIHNKNRLLEILQNFAKILQATGQSILLEDACRHLSPEGDYQKYGMKQILELLCQHGLLIIDGQYVRFWHSALQEYFYAAAVASDWRASRSEVGPPSRKIVALFRDPQNQDSLTYLIVHLSHNEMVRALNIALKVSPALAAAWIDDLSAENRNSLPVRHYLKRFGEISLALQRYSRLYVSSWWEAVALLHIAIFLVAWFMSGQHDSIRSFSDAMFYLCLPLPLSIGALVYGRLSGVFLAKDRLTAIFGSVANVRNPWLRLQLTHLLQGVSQSRWARADVKKLSRTVNSQQIQHDPRALLMDDDSLFISIITLGYLKHENVVNILASITTMNNAYANAAVQALTLRWRRFPDERERIINILNNIWHSDWADSDILSRVKKGLRLAKQVIDRPNKPLVQRAVFAGRICASGLLVIFGLLGVLWASVSLASTALLLLVGVPLLGYPFLVPCLVLRDARKLGAKNIHGYFEEDGLAPSYYALMSTIWILNLIKYIALRDRIRRNAKRIDWAFVLGEASKNA